MRPTLPHRHLPAQRAGPLGAALVCALMVACKGGSIDVPAPAGSGARTNSVTAEGAGASDDRAAPTAPSRATAAPVAEADEGSTAVAAPAAATPGDVLPPPPNPAPRLGKGGAVAGGPATEPQIPCDQLAPDDGFKLAHKTLIARLPEDGKARPAGEPGPTLELCTFHKSVARKDNERQGRTGRVHHFVAAFPGREVASWTSDELERPAALLPIEAPLLAAGWASMWPTGLPDQPALAVVSGRFYDGAHGEEVHYRRVARVLSQVKGRWTFAPLDSVDAVSLDLAFVDATCPSAEAAVFCPELQRRAGDARDHAADRLERRASRLAGKAAKAKGVDGDPQSAWLLQARQHAKDKRWDAAVREALRVEMACGEPVQEARVVLDAAAGAAGGPERADPRARALPLCEPLADKGGPARKP